LGLKVTAPGTPHLKKPFAADLLLKLSTKAVIKVVEEGLFLDGNQTLDEDFSDLSPQARMSQGSLLEHVQLKVRESGVSQRKIARQFGIAQQSVNNFLHSDNVNTKTLEMYAKVFAPSLYRGLQSSSEREANCDEPEGAVGVCLHVDD
jgi:predicted XRE-type DNA-binding protein